MRMLNYVSKVMKLCLFTFMALIFSCNDNLNKKVSVNTSDSLNDTMKSQVQRKEFEDHFNAALEKNWRVQRYSFPENGCEMTDSQILVKKSILTLTVELNKTNNIKPYKGGEISSVVPFLYGLFSVRMKNQIAQIGRASCRERV